jgi:peptidylprolyl isomerase/FKBP-type peptidyl-prolyl cis-trans isomerase FklB
MTIPVRAAAVLLALALLACGRPAAPPLAAGDEAAAGKVFLARNAKASGVHVTASGLEYQIVRSGPASGLSPKAGDEIKVNYEGKLLDGQVFDSSYERGAPAVMTLRDLVPGWIEALQLMRPGDEWQIWLPAKLGYGADAKGPIPPGSVLMFRIELIAVLPAQDRLGRA